MDDVEFLRPSTPNIVSKPEPEGRGRRAGSLVRVGLGDGAPDGGPVDDEPLAFFEDAAGLESAGTTRAESFAVVSISIGVDNWTFGDR